MNLNANPTAEQLRELLRRCDDAAGHHVLWVDQGGNVQLSRVRDDEASAELAKDHPNARIRFETFQAGNEYVGREAALDDEWVSELFASLVRRWRQAKGKPEVVYLDAL